jgi:hypothetical protein
MTFPDPIEKMVRCDCGCSVLHMEFFKDEQALTLSMYERGLDHPWKYRLKYIWDILRYGRPYADSIVIGKQGAKEIAKWLQEHLEG